jgi:hypothetical protein
MPLVRRAQTDACAACPEATIVASGPASLNSRYGKRKRSIKMGPVWEGTGCFGGQVSVRGWTRDPVGRGSQQVMRGIHEIRKPRRLGNFPAVPTSLVTPTMKDGFRETSRCCGGSFAKQVVGNVENGEAPTLLRERLEIRLDGNLDGLFTGMYLDANRRVAKINLVMSSVVSSNDGVGHYRLALKDFRNNQ